MTEALKDFLEPNHSGFNLSILQMMLRAALVYVIAIGMVRFGSKRFMGRNATFDLILGIILGSVLSRGITGQSPFWPTMAAGAVLMVMHWLIAAVACRWNWFAPLVKGRARLLVKNGELLEKAMRRSHLGTHDLEEAMRLAGVTSLQQVREAHLERNGNISIVTRPTEVKTVEVTVLAGVQTVRIEVQS